MGLGSAGYRSSYLIGQQEPKLLDCVRPAFRAHLRLHESMIQRAVKAAVRKAGMPRHATCHTFHHSGDCPALCGITHLLEAGYDLSAPACRRGAGKCNAQVGMRTLQEPLGHKDVKTTMAIRTCSTVAGWATAVARIPCGSALGGRLDENHLYTRFPRESVVNPQH